MGTNQIKVLTGDSPRCLSFLCNECSYQVFNDHDRLQIKKKKRILFIFKFQGSVQNPHVSLPYPSSGGINTRFTEIPFVWFFIYPFFCFLFLPDESHAFLCRQRPAPGLWDREKAFAPPCLGSNMDMWQQGAEETSLPFSSLLFGREAQSGGGGGGETS